MRNVTIERLVAAAIAALAIGSHACAASPQLAPNGGFEQGLSKWTAWGTNSNLITVDSTIAHSGKNSARIQVGHNALCFSTPMTPGKAYELRCFYRLAGKNPTAQVSLNYYIKNGTHRSAGYQIVPLPAGKPGWNELRKVFMPSMTTSSCQIAFQGTGDTTIWVDDVSLKEVPRPAGMRPAPDPWVGMAHRTKNPLFTELLTTRHGGYSVVSWTHNLNIKNLPADRLGEFRDPVKWDEQLKKTYLDSAQHGLGYMDMPGGLSGEFGSRTTAFHYDLYRKYGVRFDIWTEGSGTTAAALKRGAELLNPRSRALGSKALVSVVDPHYVDAQEAILTGLGQTMRDKPFRGVYYGKDEPSVHIPDGTPDKWGAYGQQMSKEVMANYGYGKFSAPVPKDPAFENDPNKPLRWIAYNRWASDKWFETRTRLYKALHAVDPRAVYSPADYWFMSGFVPFDYPRLASCTDVFEIDPYASSGERRRGRGVYNHGFGPKFISDLTGKRVRVIAQAFDYAGYSMKPEDLREWVSQAMRCGASAIDYYTMDNPQYTDPERWKMMLHIAKVVSTMPKIALPTDPDTAVLYASYTHMSMGSSTGGDQIYSAHALVGEMAGSWYRFVADSQIETGERDLTGYKVVYLPIGEYMTPEATAKIEAYVRGGGVLVCGDPECFGRDLRGNDTSKTRETILGVRPIGPAKATKIRISAGFPGIKAGAILPIFGLEQDDGAAAALAIGIVDKTARVLGTYPDGRPAIVSHKLGKGAVITFAANPFAPMVTVENSQWPAVFKSLQKHFGCKVDRPIWRFELPDMQ